MVGMNFGECPYEDCNEQLDWLSVPEQSPVFYKDSCPKCQRVVWRKLSRLDPEALTVEQFQHQYVVDEATKQVKAVRR